MLSFSNLDLISPVCLREIGKNGGYAALTLLVPSIPGYQPDSVERQLARNITPRKNRLSLELSGDRPSRLYL
jgi:hypothetical protein